MSCRCVCALLVDAVLPRDETCPSCVRCIIVSVAASSIQLIGSAHNNMFRNRAKKLAGKAAEAVSGAAAAAASSASAAESTTSSASPRLGGDADTITATSSADAVDGESTLEHLSDLVLRTLYVWRVGSQVFFALSPIAAYLPQYLAMQEGNNNVSGGGGRLRRRLLLGMGIGLVHRARGMPVAAAVHGQDRRSVISNSNHNSNHRRPMPPHTQVRREGWSEAGYGAAGVWQD